jgi:hypothetical protein
MAQQIKEKMERLGKPLKEWDVSIYRGILTGFNEAFIIDQATRDALVEKSPKDAEIIRPLLRGRDIKKWKPEFKGLYLINTHNGIKSLGIPRIDVEKDYPDIFEHLKQYEEKLKKRYDKGDHWTNLRSLSYTEDFDKEKIVYIEIMTDNITDGYDFPAFSYDAESSVVLNTGYLISGDEVKYILAYLNSSSNRFLIKSYVMQLQQRQFRMLRQDLERLPIPCLRTKEKKQVIDLTEKLLILKNLGKDYKKIETEIDEIFYSHFKLSTDEILYLKNGGF